MTTITKDVSFKKFAEFAILRTGYPMYLPNNTEAKYDRKFGQYSVEYSNGEDYEGGLFDLWDLLSTFGEVSTTPYYEEGVVVSTKDFKNLAEGTIFKTEDNSEVWMVLDSGVNEPRVYPVWFNKDTPSYDEPTSGTIIFVPQKEKK